VKSKTVAGFLALFGGVFGIHRFYLNEAPVGIFYIFLFIFSNAAIKFPITALLGVIDCIRLFSMSTAEFDKKYNSGQQRQRGFRSRRRIETGQSRQVRNERVVKNSQVRRQRKPKSNPFKVSGLKKYKDFDLQHAMEDLNKALLVDDTDSEIYFTMACCYSLQENHEASYLNLQKAVNTGMKDLTKIDKEDNLAFLRTHKDFEEFKDNGFQMTRTARLNAPQTENLLENDVLLSQLNKLAELRKKGLLSEKEFEYERKKLLRN
jgi:TM2 domain-containing membrane protein YozV